jgi:hypothetical protein
MHELLYISNDERGYVPNIIFNGAHGGVIRGIVIVEMIKHATATHMSRENPVVILLVKGISIKIIKDNYSHQFFHECARRVVAIRKIQFV